MIDPQTVFRSSYSITYNPPIANGYGFSESCGLQHLRWISSS